MRTAALASLAALWLILPLAAATTTTWEMTSYQDFLRGKFSGVSLDRDGRLAVAPPSIPLFDSGEAVIWTLVRTSSGTLYAGSGHGGKVFEIAPSGKSKLLWTAAEPEVFALALAPDGALFAATSPDGKIYRIENGAAKVFFDPHAKYIWALALAADGTLFAGTGNQGKVYRIDSKGNGEVYYDTGQSHVTALALDAQGRLLAGTGPNGVLYRIGAKNKAFALYDSSLPEIRNVTVAPDGSILLAAMGGSIASRVGTQASPAAVSSTSSPSPVMSVTVTDSSSTQAGADIKPKPPAPAAPAQPLAVAPVSPIVEVAGVEKSAIYRIDSNNMVETLWSSKEDNLFDFSRVSGSLYLATGSQGRIYRLDADHKAVLMTQTGESETVRLLASPSGLLAATAGMGKLFRLGGTDSASGSYEAPVHDAGSVARWGRITFLAGGQGRVRFETRAGNSAHPDATWSEWTPTAGGAGDGSVQSPNARFIQWRARLEGNATVESVSLALLPQNAAPTVRSINVTGLGPSAAAARSTPSSAASYSVTVTDSGEAQSPSTGTPADTLSRPAGAQMQISWQADDPDNDKLVYALSFRADGQSRWMPLKDNLSDNSYTLDSDALADGRYFFRVVASDRPSNPPDAAREADLVSSPVLIDNTPPTVRITGAKRDATAAELDIDAEDAASPLRRCEFSVDAGPWTEVEASSGITDSPHEQFHIRAALTPGEHLLVVRVFDSAGNAGLAKTILR